MAGYRTIFVRAAAPHLNFAKDLEIGHEVHSIQVHGFDELGRPVCPVFEVPECEEIVSAIYKEAIFDVDEKGARIPKSAGRLVRVEPGAEDSFPKWIGHPKMGDSLNTILETTKLIRAEQVKGDAFLGLKEPSTPYTPSPELLMDTAADTLEKRIKATEDFEKRLEASTPTHAGTI